MGATRVKMIDGVVYTKCRFAAPILGIARSRLFEALRNNEIDGGGKIGSIWYVDLSKAKKQYGIVEQYTNDKRPRCFNCGNLLTGFKQSFCSVCEYYPSTLEDAKKKVTNANNSHDEMPHPMLGKKIRIFDKDGTIMLYSDRDVTLIHICDSHVVVEVNCGDEDSFLSIHPWSDIKSMDTFELV
jgi:hypothetical protein